jgi:predicted metalloprotease with PDZ domain
VRRPGEIIMRTSSFLSVPAAFAGCFAACSPALAQERAEFRFRFHPPADTASVEVRYPGCSGDVLELAMPAWKPGSYTVRDFGKNVAGLVAVAADGTELATESTGTNSWRITTGGAADVTVRYELRLTTAARGAPGFSLGKGLGQPRVVAPEPTDNAAGGDAAKQPTREEADEEPPIRTWPAYGFEGPACWIYVPGKIGIPHTVSFDLPAEFGIATGMERVDGSTPTFRAPDYDVFADCPFHVGNFELLEFVVDEVDYEIVLSGFERDRNDRSAMVDRYRRIVTAHHAMWGRPAFTRYVFLIGFPGGGGLEHLNSCDMGMMDLRGSEPGKPSVWDSLMSHEFFHAWNVKRLRPKALGPFDYSGPNRTKFLWLSEGVTSYFGDVLLVRAGVWEPEHFWLSAIGDEIRSLQANPGRLKMSIAEASWTVWDAPYMRRGRTAPDYYNKGMLLGLLLDIEIRDATDGKKSFDDVMRALYAQCQSTGVGFEDADVQRICEELTERSFADFFAKYVEGTEELPYRDSLAKIGIRYTDGTETPSTTEGEAGDTEPATTPRRRPRARIRLEFDGEAGERALALRKGIETR